MENTPSDGDSGSQSGVLGSLDRWKQYLVAIAAILTVVAQLWGIVENQWKLASITLLLAALIVALYVVLHRVPIGQPKVAETLRLSMIGLLIAIPLCSLAGLYLYSYLPRQLERGATTIAVAEFAGPPLPDPYKDCRPSDMLVHTLVRTSARFGGVTAFELPYSIQPDNRWASQWAQFHGLFEAADVIVYGEYTLFNSKNPESSDKPDSIVINPEVARVPAIPLAFTSAPLYSWISSGSVARIQDLCGSDLREAGHPARFLDDARRVAVAIAGLQALGRRNFQAAQDALQQAQAPEVAAPQACAGDTAGTVKDSLCPGVLAFYLATLDSRLGNLARAAQEYRFAAGRLGTPEPYINLGELEMRLGNAADAFVQFDRAVAADPGSVAAVATRAQYERDYLRPQEAAIDLRRALDLQKAIDDGNLSRGASYVYDRLVLSRALYQRGGPGDAACGIAQLGRVLYSTGRSNPGNVDAQVQYGAWLRGDRRYPEAIAELQSALATDPDHVQGNYVLGLAYEQSAPHTESAARSYFERAEFAPAYTDGDFLYQANAANELAAHYDGDAVARKADVARARNAYGRAIHLNTGAVYAYYGRALLEAPSERQEALRDFQIAARLHPDDAMIQSAFAQFLDSLGRRDEARGYHDRARAAIDGRISKDERQTWSAQSCGYVAAPAPSS